MIETNKQQNYDRGFPKVYAQHGEQRAEMLRLPTMSPIFVNGSDKGGKGTSGHTKSY